MERHAMPIPLGKGLPQNCIPSKTNRSVLAASAFFLACEMNRFHEMRLHCK
jgi:hypothetical protein